MPPMNFSSYFHDWLFDKYGYYQKPYDIGKAGDFYTAVSTSQFFGGVIANKIISTIEQGILDKQTTIVDIGAHRGYLLADIIQFIYTLKPKLLKSLKFLIIEQNRSMLQAQRSYMKQSFGDEIDISFADSLDEISCSSAFVVANELFDTFDCEMVWTDKQNNLKKAIVQEHKIKFVDMGKKERYLKNICERYSITKGEVSLGFEEFAGALRKSFDRFEFVAFDYGEYHHRQDFSCRIYSRHKVLPIFHDGIQLQNFYQNSDITYDVCFAHLVDSFESCGIQKLAYQTQLQALVEFGLVELLEMLKNNTDHKIYQQYISKIKPLIDPAQMGERFKMVHFRYKNG